MNTATLSYDALNGISTNFGILSLIENSKKKIETLISERCSKSNKQIYGIPDDCTFPEPFLGKCMVDPVIEIKKSNSIESLIAISRNSISENIADSLLEIHNYPLQEDELPLNLTSVKNFLLYSYSKGLNSPILTATHDGMLQSDWDNADGPGTVAIRFLSNDKARVTTQTEEMRGTVEIKLASLIADESPINLPSWANE